MPKALATTRTERRQRREIVRLEKELAALRGKHTAAAAAKASAKKHQRFARKWVKGVARHLHTHRNPEVYKNSLEILKEPRKSAAAAFIAARAVPLFLNMALLHAPASWIAGFIRTNPVNDD